MALKVEFPDGGIRDVPSRTREIKSREIGGPRRSVFVEEPVYDPEWTFETAIGGKWWATPRIR
jgi:hypothetical protein